ncbi:MAG TPA: ABC transporter permease [Blastocatellia bacterium]|nr:ABC transporter permease [Blastocatellia bacterium]
MRTSTLLKRNLAYYWRTNLAVVLGVGTAVAVLAGALLVGDSVRGSLRDLFLMRLGKADYVITSASFFREQFASEIASHSRFPTAGLGQTCPLIVFEGLVSHQESGHRAGNVQVYGVDERFWRFHGRDGVRPPDEREVLLSAALAQELESKPGDSLLVSVEKPSAIPAESLHGRKEEMGRTIRLSVSGSIPASEMGEFSVRPQQGAVRAVFLSLTRLQKDLEQTGRANAILVSSARPDGGSAAALEQIVKETFKLEDLGIKLRRFEDRRVVSLETESAVLSDSLAEAAQSVGSTRGSPFLTYLVNSIAGPQREVPYSLVTAVSEDQFQSLRQSSSPASAQGEQAGVPPVLLNDWAARDLGVKPGDRVTLEYYLWQHEGQLSTEKAEFQVAGILPISGLAADRDLVPEYPGITETDSLSDWDPPFPMDLGKVRPVDEDYWDKYRTTPKAFIPLSTGARLWGSRFGRLTSLRFPIAGEVASDKDLQSSSEAFSERLRERLDPLALGLAVFPARAQGLTAATGATDFGQYFVYFSFFLVVSALLLAALFFKLGVEQRLKEIGLLRAFGFPAAKIRNLFLIEGVILAAAGSLIGAAGAVLYGWLVMLGLKTWWVGAVGTTLLSLHISPVSLIAGGVGGMLTALAIIAWTLRSLAPLAPRSLLAGTRVVEDVSKSERRRRRFSARTAGIALGISGLLLLALASAGMMSQVAGFFGAGASLLISLLCFQSAWLRKERRQSIQGSGRWAVSRLGFRNTTYKPGRSVLCIALIASATFIIVAVDAFRRDTSAASADPKSGSGGYPLVAESLIPLVPNPNAAEGKESLNLFSHGDSALNDVKFERFRLKPGDDASCLNLYQPKNPRILGATDGFIKAARFDFQDSVAATAEEESNPWLLLDKETGDGSVPVIADANSIAYVLHMKLGDEFVLDRGGDAPLRLRLVAALSDSVFQGEMLMSESNFLRLFPEQEGYRFFLIDVKPERSSEVAGVLEESLSDFGFDAVPTSERLAVFHRVENTYLSTFQTLGGLGLVLGTLGLATVLLRNVLERRRELALLRAVGYESEDFAIMAIAENLLLLLSGLALGTVSALLAIAPAFVSRSGSLPTFSLGLVLLAVLLTGLITSVVATLAALRSPLLPALKAE